MPPLLCLKNRRNSTATNSDATNTATRISPNQEIANKMLHIMLGSNTTPVLRRKVTAQLPCSGWNEAIARHLLDSLVRQVNAGAGVATMLGDAMQDAHDVAKAGTIDREYPNLASAGASLTALGMLTIVMPDAVGALGFRQAKPAPGSFADVWQRTYSNITYSVFYKYLHGLDSGVLEIGMAV